MHDETSIEALADLHITCIVDIANFLNLTKGLKKIILVAKSLHGCGKMQSYDFYYDTFGG